MAETPSQGQVIINKLTTLINDVGRLDERLKTLEREQTVRNKSDEHMSTIVSRMDSKIDSMSERIVSIERHINDISGRVEKHAVELITIKNDLLNCKKDFTEHLEGHKDAKSEMKKNVRWILTPAIGVLIVAIVLGVYNASAAFLPSPKVDKSEIEKKIEIILERMEIKDN